MTFWRLTLPGRLAGLTVASAMLAGCVTAGTLEELQRRYSDEQRRATTLETELDLAKRRVDALEAERAALQSSLAQAQRDKASMLSDNTQMAANIEQMQQALRELDERKRAAEARVQEFRDLVARFKPLVDTGKLTVKIVDGRMVVVLATDVLFASGSAKLSEAGTSALREVATLLAQLGDKRFQVEGHTDSVPISSRTFPSNWELAAARALTVVKTMVDAGMAPQRISGAAFGEFKPAASNETKEGQAQNRRIEIVLVPDLSGRPGFEELKKLQTEG
jgi:chemotaxis protein MotB